MGEEVKPSVPQVPTKLPAAAPAKTELSPEEIWKAEVDHRLSAIEQRMAAADAKHSENSAKKSADRISMTEGLKAGRGSRGE